MKKEVRHPEKQSHTGSYSAGVIAGDFLFISGQGPLDNGHWPGSARHY